MARQNFANAAEIWRLRSDAEYRGQAAEQTRIDNQTRAVQNLMDIIYRSQAAQNEAAQAESRRAENAVLGQTLPGGTTLRQEMKMADYLKRLEEIRASQAKKTDALALEKEKSRLRGEIEDQKGRGLADREGVKQDRLDARQRTKDRAAMERAKLKGGGTKTSLAKAEDELFALRQELAANPDNTDLIERVARAEANVKRLSGVTAAVGADSEKNLESAKTLMSDVRALIQSGEEDATPITGVPGAAKAKFGGLARQAGMPVSPKASLLRNKLETLKGIITPMLMNEKKVTDAERERIDRVVGNMDVWTDDVDIMSGMSELETFLDQHYGAKPFYTVGDIYVDKQTGAKARYLGPGKGADKSGWELVK